MEVLRISKSNIEKKRQDNFEDTGFCSSINQTRTGTMDGVAPQIKPETTEEPVVLDGYITFQSFLLQTLSSGLGGCTMTL
jgi:hypothetical protein